MLSYAIVDKSCHRRKEEVHWVERFFAANGWRRAASVEAADCVILFTCAEMRYKVVNMLKEVECLSTKIGDGAEFIVGSCLPRTNASALKAIFSGKTITPTDFSALNQLPGISVRIEQLPPIFGKDSVCRPFEEPGPWAGADAIPYSLSRWAAGMLRRYYPGRNAVAWAARLCRTRRTAIYVSAGCAKGCSYCAIRFATGHVRSKPPGVILQNITDGLRLGYRTFDFLSDSIGGYGTDLGTNLGALLEQVVARPGSFTIGISDLHPHEFLKYFESILALCRARKLHYLYVPVQSASERILRLMNRACDMRAVALRMQEIRRFDEVFLQSGIMAGFPGETEADFEETISFLKEIGFDNVYVHYYCDMPYTAASVLPDKTDKDTMVARLEKIARSGVPFNVEKTRIEWESTLAIS